MTALCIVRIATADDSDGILACLREAFDPYREAYTAAAFADTVLTPGSLAVRFATMTILVAVGPEGAILGTIALCGDADVGHLRGMAVGSAWQGQGVAGQLLTRAEQMLRDAGCGRVTLDTTAPLVRAIAFYRRNGYMATGRTQDFYGMALYEFAKELRPL